MKTLKINEKTKAKNSLLLALKGSPALFWFHLKVKKELPKDFHEVVIHAVFQVRADDAYQVILIGPWLTVTVTAEIELNPASLDFYHLPLPVVVVELDAAHVAAVVHLEVDQQQHLAQHPEARAL